MTRTVDAGVEDGGIDEVSPDHRVGTVVARLRDRAGLSQRDVAKRAGMSAMQLSRVERLESSPTEEKIAGLARALEVPPGYLFGDESVVSADPLVDRHGDFMHILVGYCQELEQTRTEMERVHRKHEETLEALFAEIAGRLELACSDKSRGLELPRNRSLPSGIKAHARRQVDKRVLQCDLNRKCDLYTICRRMDDLRQERRTVNSASKQGSHPENQDPYTSDGDPEASQAAD